ncbi:O-antigen ligase family protein [Actinomadura sp. 3N407]|uniref:O-antigen ligase family protein n=1 Tax=Actinomadura sp. 3N407 TaxID=3457423 RepID=UPI003FCC8256
MSDIVTSFVRPGDEDGDQASRPSAGLDLPVWPLTLLFGFFPIFWVLGLGAFAAMIAAVPMLALLVLRPNTRVPAGFGVWLLFLAWMLTAVTQLDSAGRVIGFVFRFGNYLSATIFLVYIYNCSRRSLPFSRIVGLVVLFWFWVVLGGFLGVLFPHGNFTTPVELVMPQAIGSNDYVADLIHPKFAQVQQPWGVAEPFVRPSAPFPYTNSWGSHLALLTPFALLYATTGTADRRWKRWAVVVLLPASLIPAFATLNRGMFLAVGIGVCYVALRFGARGQVRWMAGVVMAILVGLVAAYMANVEDVLSSRTEHSGTNDSRLAIYEEAFTRTLESPLLGYGAPRPSETLDIPAGTHGQFWNVMFSFGFPALLLFCLWMAVLVRHTHSAPGPMLWLHAPPVMTSCMMFYYGLDDTELVVVFVAAAIVLREFRESARAGPESGQRSWRTPDRLSQPVKAANRPDSAMPRGTLNP